MRYRLRTLLIVLAVLPPLLAAAWFTIAGLVSEPASILDMGEVLSILMGLAIGIGLAIACGIAVARIGNAVIGFWDDP